MDPQSETVLFLIKRKFNILVIPEKIKVRMKENTFV